MVREMTQISTKSLESRTFFPFGIFPSSQQKDRTINYSYGHHTDDSTWEWDSQEETEPTDGRETRPVALWELLDSDELALSVTCTKTNKVPFASKAFSILPFFLAT